MTDKALPELDELTQPFYAAIQRDELHIQRCGDCKTWVFYPNHWCTHCYSEQLTWTPCSGRGSVYSFSVVHYVPYPSYSDVPYVLATIELEEGPHLMTNLVNCAWESVAVGMEVQLTTESRAGGFKVPQFEPA